MWYCLTMAHFGKSGGSAKVFRAAAAAFALAAALASCASYTVPPEYAPSKVWVGSRSTPREALELFQRAIWEERTEVAYPILSAKTREKYGPFDFWVGLAFTFPPCETAESIPKSAWITIEEFLKYAKIRQSKMTSDDEAVVRVSVEFGADGRYQFSQAVLMAREREGWALKLAEMFERQQ